MSHIPALNAQALANRARMLHDAAKEAQRHLKFKPHKHPSFWSKEKRVYVRELPGGVLCLHERQRSGKYGQLIARSVAGDWHKLDPKFNTDPALGVRLS